MRPGLSFCARLWRAFLPLALLGLSGNLACTSLLLWNGGKKAQLGEAASARGQWVASSDGLVQSLSLNRLTSRAPDPQKARQLASKLAAQLQAQPSQAKDTLTALIVAERLGGASMDQLLQRAQQLVDAGSGQGLENSLAPAVKLELALAALAHQRLGLANFLLDELSGATEKEIKAGVLTARGLIAMQSGAIPEAVQAWQEALKVDKSYEAALLNLGFVSLEFGAFKEAANYLERLPRDWFASSGRLVALRLSGKTEEAGKLCAQLLSRFGQHKPTLFNCGLYHWQIRSDSRQARQLIEQALSLKGGPASWQSQGSRVLKQLPSH